MKIRVRHETTVGAFGAKMIELGQSSSGESVSCRKNDLPDLFITTLRTQDGRLAVHKQGSRLGSTTRPIPLLTILAFQEMPVRPGRAVLGKRTDVFYILAPAKWTSLSHRSLLLFLLAFFIRPFLFVITLPGILNSFLRVIVIKKHAKFARWKEFLFPGQGEFEDATGADGGDGKSRLIGFFLLSSNKFPSRKQISIGDQGFSSQNVELITVNQYMVRAEMSERGQAH
jgi:hypothetical protein